MNYFSWCRLWESAEEESWVDALGGAEFRNVTREWVEMGMPHWSREDLANYVNARGPGFPTFERGGNNHA